MVRLAMTEMLERGCSPTRSTRGPRRVVHDEGGNNRMPVPGLLRRAMYHDPNLFEGVCEALQAGERPGTTASPEGDAGG